MLDSANLIQVNAHCSICLVIGGGGLKVRYGFPARGELLVVLSDAAMAAEVLLPLLVVVAVLKLLIVILMVTALATAVLLLLLVLVSAPELLVAVLTDAALVA